MAVADMTLVDEQVTERYKKLERLRDAALARLSDMVKERKWEVPTDRFGLQNLPFELADLVDKIIFDTLKEINRLEMKHALVTMFQFLGKSEIKGPNFKKSRYGPHIYSLFAHRLGDSAIMLENYQRKVYRDRDEQLEWHEKLIGRKLLSPRGLVANTEKKEPKPETTVIEEPVDMNDAFAAMWNMGSKDK